MGYYEDDSVAFYESVPMVRLRMIYFVICFAFSIYSPFFVLYMKNDIGLSAGQVGLVAALQIVGGYVVGPLISLLVDKFRIHKPVWIAAMLLCIIPVELISLAKSFHSAIGIALFIAALNAPISSLMDSSTLWMDFTVIHEAGDDIFEDSLSFFHSITLLIPSWSYVFFLGVSIVAGFGATSLQSLLLMFLSDLGASDFLEGLTLSVATISELPIFWASGAI